MLHEKIWKLFCEGHTPRQIDSILGIEPGTAHAQIVERWAWDSGKDGRTRERA